MEASYHVWHLMCVHFIILFTFLFCFKLLLCAGHIYTEQGFMKEWHWRHRQYLKWPTEAFTYFPGNKVSIYFFFFFAFLVSAHIRLMKDGAAGLACSSGRDSWLIRAWSIDLEYHQIYYCGRTMRAHSCNYRPDQYWLEIYWKKKKASNANRQFFLLFIYLGK